MQVDIDLSKEFKFEQSLFRDPSHGPTGKLQVRDFVVQFPKKYNPDKAQVLEINQHSNTCSLLNDNKGTFSGRIFKWLVEK